MREDQNRREKIRLRSGRKGDEEMINELEQRLMMVNGDGCPFPKRGQGSKLDSSQIKDGDFEKIMIGKLPSSMLFYTLICELDLYFEFIFLS